MIIYTVICRVRDVAVLVEVSSPELSGNAPQVTTKLLTHLRDHPELLVEGEYKTFVQRNQQEEDFLSNIVQSCASVLNEEPWDEDYYFHLLMRDGVFYCCIGDDPDIRDQKVNFAFLEQVATEFAKRHRKGRIDTANAYALDKDFSPTVRSAMHYHNINHNSIAQEERVMNLMAKVDNMKHVMGAHIHLMLERADRLDKLVDQSESLEEDAAMFKRKSTLYRRRHQRKYWFKKMVLAALITVVLSMFLYVTTIAVCGAKLQYCRRGKSSGENNADDSQWAQDSDEAGR